MKTVAAVLAAVVAGGCVSHDFRQEAMQADRAAADWELSLAALRPPKDERERQEVCTSLRVERAKMESLIVRAHSMHSPAVASDIDYRGRRNIALLDGKMAEFRC